jgi:hypothetical protein
MAEASKNSVLYLSYDGLTDPLGQSQILPYVIGLSKLSWRITVVSFEKAEVFTSGKSDIQNICDQHGIEWMPLSYTKWPPVLSTLFDLWRLRSKVKARLKNEPGCIIHCRSYLTALVGQSMKK